MRRPVYPPPHFVARRDARKKIRDEMKRWRVDRLLLAGLRPSGAAIATSPVRLHLSLLRDLQRVVDVDTKVSDGALSELI